MNYYVIVITLLILRLGKLYYEWKSYIIPETIHLGTVQSILLQTGIKTVLTRNQVVQRSPWT